MRKLLLGSVLALVAVSANAEKWHYELSKSDFSVDYKVATLKDKVKGYELSVSMQQYADDVNNSAIVSIDLPQGKVAAFNCRQGCEAKINVDGDKNAYPPIRLLAFSNFKSYGVTGESKNFIDVLRKAKVVKVLLPVSGGDFDVATFTLDKPFDDNEFKNIK